MVASVEDFIKFVNEQDSSRVIDHTAWETCAVGNYHEEYETRETEDYCTFLQKSNLGKVIFEYVGYCGPETYGDLKKEIEYLLEEYDL